MSTAYFRPASTTAAYFREHAALASSVSTFVQWVHSGKYPVPHEALVLLAANFPSAVKLLPVASLTPEIADAAMDADVSVATELRLQAPALVDRHRRLEAKRHAKFLTRLAAGGAAGAHVSDVSDVSADEEPPEAEPSERPARSSARKRAKQSAAGPFEGWSAVAFGAPAAAANRAKLERDTAELRKGVARMLALFRTMNDPAALAAADAAKTHYERQLKIVTPEVRAEFERQLKAEQSCEAQPADLDGNRAYVQLRRHDAPYAHGSTRTEDYQAAHWAVLVAQATAVYFRVSTWNYDPGRLVFGGEASRVQAAIEVAATLVNEAAHSPNCECLSFLQGFGVASLKFFERAHKARQEVAESMALAVQQERADIVERLAETMREKNVEVVKDSEPRVRDAKAFSAGLRRGTAMAKRKADGA